MLGAFASNKKNNVTDATTREYAPENPEDDIGRADDEYTQPEGAQEEAPTTFGATIKYLGPSVIISATIVGSGEIILTASLGAAVGYVMLWWVLFLSLIHI